MIHRIWLHGLGQGPESWRQTLDRLPRGEEHCPALFSLAEPSATYDGIYAGLCRYCNGLEGPLHLCGLSLGAVLGLQYAAEHPCRVASLVLIAPQYRMPRRLLALQDLLFRLMPERSFREAGLSKTELLRLTGSMRQLDLTPLLPAVRCPTLVLCGNRDRAGLRTAEGLAELLPRAAFRKLSEAGHEVNTQAPETLAKILADFYAPLV